MNIFSRAVASFKYRSGGAVFGKSVGRRVDAYLKKNGLDKLAAEARSALDSTGADDSDYALLHSFVRNKRPRYVLECGTGLTTWMIAHALKANWEEDGRPEERPMVVSMEDHEGWFKQAGEKLPEEFREFVDLRQSKRVYDHYSFVFGVRYEEIPDLPYEMVWVDGPVARFTKKEPFDWDDEAHEHVCLMDIVRLVQRGVKFKAVMIDNAKRTQISYACLFGPDKIKAYTYWSNVGVMENVSEEDLIANTERYLKIFHHIVPKAKGFQAPLFFRD